MNEPTPEQERRHIAGRAAVVAAGTLASRLLGLGRDIAVASVFSRAATDAWMLAFQIPNLLRQLLAEGAVQTAVLPVLTRQQEERGESEARRFFQALRGASFVVLGVVTVGGIVFSDELVELFAPGFKDIPGQHELATQLTRASFPYIFFMSSAALGLAALNSKRRFVVTSFAPALLNISLIGAALTLPVWLASRGHPPILALAIGAIAGGILQVLAQLPSLRAIGYLGLPRLSLSTPGLRDVATRLAPTLLGIGVYYVDVVVGRRILSEMGQGAITYYSYALRLCDFSQGIFVMALSSATLPALASFAARGQLDEVGETFAYAMRHALFIGVLATAGFVTLAEPIVFVLLQRGQFDPIAAQETTRALIAQGFGIFLVAGVRQLVLVYFALGDTKTPVLVAAIDVLIFATTALALRGQLGHVGVSVAVSVARLGQFCLLFWLLKRHLPQRHGRLLATSSMKAAVAATFGSALVLLATTFVPFTEAHSLLPRLLYLVLMGLLLLGGFVLAARKLDSPELETVLAPLWSRWSRWTRRLR